MGFSKKIKEDILVASARHCCVCHKHKGLNIEVHHIVPKQQNGKDTFENAIALCFDCHSDAGHYFADHPKGTNLSPSELIKHKENWFENVKRNQISFPSNIQVKLSIENSNNVFRPIFIEETTIYKDKNVFINMNYMEMVEKMKVGKIAYDFFLNQIKTYDDFISYLNGDVYEKYQRKEEENCQPIKFSFSGSNFKQSKQINHSVCKLNLKLFNYGEEVIENYKVYLNFENFELIDVVSKKNDFFDFNKYDYNISFKDNNNAEFIPSVPILVQNDFIDINQICFKSTHLQTISYIHWKIVARNFNFEGKIEIIIRPIIEIKEVYKYVENPENYKTLKEIKNKYEFY